MKKFILTLLFICIALSDAQPQKIYLVKRYGEKWNTDIISTKNKPNGYIYRLRVDVQRHDLPRVPEVEGLELFIAEPIDIGWMTLYRLPTAAEDYNFVTVIYNHDSQPIHVINLCDITHNRYCEVQDIRWDDDNHRLLFNMACPSYAEMIDGKGSKLYSYDVVNRRIAWETDYLVSNDIFITDDKFVFCSYGFTNERKYLFMLDKQNGKVYSKLPMVYSVQYMELHQEQGREMLYVVDYNDHLYSFAVNRGNVTSAKTSREPEVFTVVFATSEDGFLNVRQSGSTKAKILTQLYGPMHGLGSGVLREKGETWSKISVYNVTGWVYNKYLGYQTWYDGLGDTILIADRDNTPIYGENYVDEDEGYPLFTTVKKGTVIADQFDEHQDYYILKTGHDYLFIKKEDVRLLTQNPPGKK